MIILTTVDEVSGKDINVNLLHELGSGDMSPEKVRDIWLSYSKHAELFSDTTDGSFEIFFDVLTDPRSIWFELEDVESGMTLGVMSVSRIIPGFDAWGHFAIWNGKARGKEKIILGLMSLIFEKYRIHRMSCEIPAHQKGVSRFIKRLGFKEEGVRREGVLKKGSWVDMLMFGMVESELEEALNG